MKKTNKIIKFILHTVPVFIISLSFVTMAFAQNSTGGGATTIPNPFSGGDTLNQLIVAILNNVVMPLAGVASVGYIIWAGFQYVRAQGKPEKIKEANTNLLFALIGIGVLLGAAGISAVVQRTIQSLTNITP